MRSLFKVSLFQRSKQELLKLIFTFSTVLAVQCLILAIICAFRQWAELSVIASFFAVCCGGGLIALASGEPLYGEHQPGDPLRHQGDLRP